MRHSPRRTLLSWLQGAVAWRLAALCCLLVLPLAVQAQESAAPVTVNCYDASTQTVETLYKSECKGQVISDEEAARVRQARVDRIRSALKAQPPPVDPSLKMVSIGTGFFIAADSSFLTNYHVVKGCTALTAETTTGLAVKASLVDSSPDDDLALLRAETPPPGIASFRSDVAINGQPIAVIGYPDHGLLPVKPFFVTGTLTGPREASGRRFAFHGDVRPGNSGGPLLDWNGLVVGVVFAKVNTPKVFQEKGELIRDVGFAISNETVMQFLGRKVAVTQAAATAQAPLDEVTLFDRSRPFILRVGCWK